MDKYKQKELRELVRLGVAEDYTNKPSEYIYTLRRPEKVGYSTGVYGINGGLVEDAETGQLYAIIGRFSKVQELRELRRMAEELAAEIDGLQDAIKQHTDAAGVDTLAGLDYKITYKAVTSSRLDSKALKADQPELYAKYTKQTTARRFCLA